MAIIFSRQDVVEETSERSTMAWLDTKVFHNLRFWLCGGLDDIHNHSKAVYGRAKQRNKCGCTNVSKNVVEGEKMERQDLSKAYTKEERDSITH